MTFESKFPQMQTTIFTVMSRLAQETGAINLSQGFPDFDGPPELLERVHHYLTSGHNQYPPMMGVPALREAIATKVDDLYGLHANPESEITVTSGATEALFCALGAVVRPGDEVILLDPAYDSYEPVVTLMGGRAVHVPLAGAGFRVDWNRVDAVLNARTRAIVINSPHNPTGSVWAPEDLLELNDRVQRFGLYVVADEVYEHIVFDGLRHESVLRYPDLYARSFVVSSFGKTYHVTGWKVGYCVAPSQLTAEFRKIHQYVTFTTATPLQLGLADFLETHPEHHLNLAAFYQRKRDLFLGALEGSRFSWIPSSGTYFQLLDYGGIDTAADSDLAERWTREVGVASIPVSVFYETPPEQRVLRFCFAKSDATLLEAAGRLRGL